MIHTLTIIRFLFPFLLLLAFFCLYKKQYRCMKSFMWRMVVFDSARKFYVSIMMLALIFINWCCCMTDPNLAVGLSSILTLALLETVLAYHTPDSSGMLCHPLYEQCVSAFFPAKCGSCLLSV